MPVASARPTNVASGNIIHLMGVRLRVVGQGNLKFSAASLQDVRSVYNPRPLSMQQITNIEPLKKFNFLDQFIKVKIHTEEMNEWFRVNRIVIFTREVFTQLPQ